MKKIEGEIKGPSGALQQKLQEKADQLISILNVLSSQNTDLIVFEKVFDEIFTHEKNKSLFCDFVDVMEDFFVNHRKTDAAKNSCKLSSEFLFSLTYPAKKVELSQFQNRCLSMSIDELCEFFPLAVYFHPVLNKLEDLVDLYIKLLDIKQERRSLVIQQIVSLANPSATTISKLDQWNRSGKETNLLLEEILKLKCNPGLLIEEGLVRNIDTQIYREVIQLAMPTIISLKDHHLVANILNQIISLDPAKRESGYRATEPLLKGVSTNEIGFGSSLPLFHLVSSISSSEELEQSLIFAGPILRQFKSLSVRARIFNALNHVKNNRSFFSQFITTLMKDLAEEHQNEFSGFLNSLVFSQGMQETISKESTSSNNRPITSLLLRLMTLTRGKDINAIYESALKLPVERLIKRITLAIDQFENYPEHSTLNFSSYFKSFVSERESQSHLILPLIASRKDDSAESIRTILRSFFIALNSLPEFCHQEVIPPLQHFLASVSSIDSQLGENSIIDAIKYLSGVEAEDHLREGNLLKTISPIIFKGESETVIAGTITLLALFPESDRKSVRLKVKALVEQVDKPQEISILHGYLSQIALQTRKDLIEKTASLIKSTTVVRLRSIILKVVGFLPPEYRTQMVVELSPLLPKLCTFETYKTENSGGPVITYTCTPSKYQNQLNAVLAIFNSIPKDNLTSSQEVKLMSRLLWVLFVDQTNDWPKLQEKAILFNQILMKIPVQEKYSVCHHLCDFLALSNSFVAKTILNTMNLFTDTELSAELMRMITPLTPSQVALLTLIPARSRIAALSTIAFMSGWINSDFVKITEGRNADHRVAYLDAIKVCLIPVATLHNKKTFNEAAEIMKWVSIQNWTTSFGAKLINVLTIWETHYSHKDVMGDSISDNFFSTFICSSGEKTEKRPRAIHLIYETILALEKLLPTLVAMPIFKDYEKKEILSAFIGLFENLNVQESFVIRQRIGGLPANVMQTFISQLLKARTIVPFYHNAAHKMICLEVLNELADGQLRDLTANAKTIYQDDHGLVNEQFALALCSFNPLHLFAVVESLNKWGVESMDKFKAQKGAWTFLIEMTHRLSHQERSENLFKLPSLFEGIADLDIYRLSSVIKSYPHYPLVDLIKDIELNSESSLVDPDVWCGKDEATRLAFMLVPSRWRGSRLDIVLKIAPMLKGLDLQQVSAFLQMVPEECFTAVFDHAEPIFNHFTPIARFELLSHLTIIPENQRQDVISRLIPLLADFPENSAARQLKLFNEISLISADQREVIINKCLPLFTQLVDKSNKYYILHCYRHNERDSFYNLLNRLADRPDIMNILRTYWSHLPDAFG